MPELGEVEIARRHLEAWWVGRAASEVLVHDQKVVTSGAERFETVMKQTAVSAHRRGKYLFVKFEDDVVVFHFRMTGQISRESLAYPKFTRASWRLGDTWLCFKDPRRLGHIDVFSAAEFQDYEPLLKMGPEPHDLDGVTLKNRVGSRVLKSALMDQQVVAGVGNIAISEVFWRLQIPPDATGKDLPDSAWSGLALELARFFDEVIALDGGDSASYVNQGGENTFDVYGHEGKPCPRCGTKISRIRVGGRSSYFCPECQPVSPQV